MNLDNIAIILCRPEESRNIGSVCRAMANCGIHDLRIVGKREDFDDERVRILAIHADKIWENARFYGSITEASADCTCAAATTRRRGKSRKGKLLLPEEFVSSLSGTAATAGKTAVVFGNERTGLTDSEVDECTIGITIPTSDEFPSLNLSHAVQIICYELFRTQNESYTGYTPINLERLDSCVEKICDNLKNIGFFKITGRPEMERFWRGILSRAALSEGEAQYIEKTFNKAAGLASAKN